MTTMKGSLVLYRIEHAYSIFDMKVTGFTLRTVSITYTTTVGNVEAKDSVTIVPEADQVNTSICPGVSNTANLCVAEAFSRNEITLSNFVANRLRDVTIAPFGPSPYCFITSL